MILHSDGRIEGTPAEIAEYKERTTKAVKQIMPNTMTKEELEKMLRETTILPLAQKYPGEGTIYTKTFNEHEYIDHMKSFGR